MKTKVGLRREPQRKLPWLVYWWDLPDEIGKQRKKTKSFKHNRAARVFQAEKQTEIDHDGPGDQYVDITLDHLLDEFVKARVHHLSYSSQQSYANTIIRLRDHFRGHRLVNQIENRHAETFISNLKRRDDHKGDLSSWSKVKLLTQCRAIFGAACEWRYISNNPFMAPKSTSSPLRVNAKSKPWHHITPDEFISFLAKVPTTRLRAIYWMMYGCGLRPGESYNLTIDRIDLSQRTVHIADRPASKDIPPFTVKCSGQSQGSKERIIPIPQAAMMDLSIACQEAFKSGGFVALTPERFVTISKYWKLCRAGMPWGNQTEHRPWLNRDMVNNLLRNTKGYIDKAGVKMIAPLTLQTFRKSYGQNHADAGTPPRVLAKLLGHSTTRVTMEFYNQVTDANERMAAMTMDRLLDQGDKRIANVS